ncbi:MAG TPA: TIR domain-containing protein [Mycobacteriales bacterium]
MVQRYGLFLSCAGQDREAARAVRRELERAGLRVFLDDEDIAPYEGITPAIEAALRSSTALLAYYSPLFPTRAACQRELTIAFVAGQREGDPMRRIMVINPVDPRSDHLMPAELADARYVPPAAGPIKARLDALSGQIGGVPHAPPRWHGPNLGSPRFVGRYRELWELHTALHRADTAMTSEETARPVASVVGMPGIGKSALVATYGHLFGAAFTGGRVLWIDLAGTASSAEAVLEAYHAGLRARAQDVRVPVRDLTDGQVAAALADELVSAPGRSLVVLDNLPAGLDPALLDQLVLPAGDRVRTVVITSSDAYEDKAAVVRVGPMSDEDAGELLRRYRTPAEGERAGFDRLVARLGGHPMALTRTGLLLRDRQGLVDFDRYAGPAAATDPLSEVVRLVGDELAKLGDDARTVLGLAVALAPVEVPTTLMRGVHELIGSTGEAAGAGLTELSSRELAERTGDSWRIHSLVREAAAARPEVPPPGPALLGAAADVIGALLTPAAEGDVLLRHAAAVLGDGRLPGAPADRLRRTLAGHHEARGEPALALAYRRRIAADHPDSSADLAAAAATCCAAGEAAEAVGLAQRALRLPADPAIAATARRALAEGLDALGRYGEADPQWLRLVGGPVGTVELQVAYARAQRLRGRRAEVERVARAVLATVPPDADAAQALQLELARVEMQTDAARPARARAEAVIEHYRRRGQDGHVRALEAQEVLAESMLTLDLWELRPDPHKWEDAERQLAALCARHRSTYGPASLIPLAAEVAHAYALVSLGRHAEGRVELDQLLPGLADRLGERHPLWLRALFARGLVFGQLGDYAAARPLHERALAGQRATLGTGHPHTLRTQYELAVALKMTGGRGWRPLLAQIRRSAPRRSDLYAQSLLASGLLLLPTPAIAAVTRRGRLGD